MVIPRRFTPRDVTVNVCTVTTRISLESALATELAALRERDLERRLRVIRSREGAVVTTDRATAIDFSSNDYLGLATDPRLASAASESMRRAGVGATASRLIAGDSAEHEALEADLAAFFQTAAALSFSSGYAANVGNIPALAGRGDVIFADELNHASLIDGCRLSRATVHVYRHSDAGDLATLVATHRSAHRRAMIVTDGMFSMDGDFAPLGEIVAIAREHDVWTYVDDAHAVGVVGANARGTVEQLGVAGDVDILVGTLGKAFGAAGAFVVGPKVLRDFLINRARAFIFSTGPMPAQAAAARAALRVVSVDSALRARVPANAHRVRAGLNARGIETLGEQDSHIVPIVVGDAARTMAVGAALAERGFLVGAVRPPTVPEGTSRLRLTVSAAHTNEQIDSLCQAAAEVLS
jgi:8-amino-7-oxononanoate synthase